MAAALVPVLSGQNRGPGMFANAEAYERFMGRWSRLVAPGLVEFAGLKDGARILDVGSGTGSLAFAIGKRYGQAHVVGIDPSKEYVGFAGARNPFPARAEFEIGDAQGLRFSDSSFDAAVSLLVFNFIPDAGKALRELCRVTKPGGSISAAVWDYGGGMRMLRLFWDAAVSVDAAAEKRDEKRMPLCRAGELLEFWKQGGLKEAREQAIDVRMRFESQADFWEPFLLGQGPAGAYVRSLRGDRVEALHDAVKRSLEKFGKDGPFELEARVWAVRGVVPGRG